MKSKSFLFSIKHAIHGLKEAFKERNFRIMLLWLILFIIICIFIKISLTDKLLIFLSIASILSLEMTNSAIERLSDFITKEHKEEIKQTKDLMAGSVLIISVSGAIILFIILLKNLL